MRPIVGRRLFSLVFQNTDGDGLVSQVGDIVITVEANPNKRPLIERLGAGYEHYFPAGNYRMTTSWRRDLFAALDDKPWAERLIPVHGPSRKPPTPRRDFTQVRGHVCGWDAALIGGHAVNSAWAPLWKPTSWRLTRVKLWWKWYKVGRDTVRRQVDAGRLVIMAVDGNRRGSWTFPGLKTVYRHGPDRILISRRHPSHLHLARDVVVGRKVGNGRVTHHSFKLTLELDRKATP